jgi:hypothetical protein
MPVQLDLTMKAQQTRQTYEPMINMVVVLEVILQAPLVLESAETQVAEDVVALGVVDMIFETVPVLEDANAQIAVVPVVWCLL